jgi:hypothetical protein
MAWWSVLISYSRLHHLFQGVCFHQVPQQNPLCTSALLLMCHTSNIPHSPLFDQPNKIWWKMQKMKVLIMQRSVAYSSARQLIQYRISQRRNCLCDSWNLLSHEPSIWTLCWHCYCHINMGNWQYFTCFPLFQKVDPTEIVCMLDPKRTRFFFNASTGKKSYFTNINSGNEKLLHFRSGKHFHYANIMYLGLWGTRRQGSGGCCIMRRLMVSNAHPILCGW